MPPFSFLRYQIGQTICSLNASNEVHPKYTYVKLQELCGTINWLKQFLPTPNEEMRGLFSLMESSPSHVMTLTEKANRVLTKVSQLADSASLQQ